MSLDQSVPIISQRVLLSSQIRSYPHHLTHQGPNPFDWRDRERAVVVQELYMYVPGKKAYMLAYGSWTHGGAAS